MALHPDNYPLQGIIQKKESPDVHSLGSDVVDILLNIKSSCCIVRKITRFKDYVILYYKPIVCPKQQRLTAKKQGNIKRQRNNKPTGVNNHIPTINESAVNLTAIAT